MLQERQRIEASPTAAAVSPMSSAPPHDESKDSSANNTDYFLGEVYNQFQFVVWIWWLNLTFINFWTIGHTSISSRVWCWAEFNGWGLRHCSKGLKNILRFLLISRLTWINVYFWEKKMVLYQMGQWRCYKYKRTNIQIWKNNLWVHGLVWSGSWF